MRIRLSREKRLFASSCQSACIRVASSGQIFVKVDTGDFLENLSTKFKFG